MFFCLQYCNNAFKSLCYTCNDEVLFIVYSYPTTAWSKKIQRLLSQTNKLSHDQDSPGQNNEQQTLIRKSHTDFAFVQTYDIFQTEVIKLSSVCVKS